MLEEPTQLFRTIMKAYVDGCPGKLPETTNFLWHCTQQTRKERFHPRVAIGR